MIFRILKIRRGCAKSIILSASDDFVLRPAWEGFESVIVKVLVHGFIAISANGGRGKALTINTEASFKTTVDKIINNVFKRVLHDVLSLAQTGRKIR